MKFILKAVVLSTFLILAGCGPKTGTGMVKDSRTNNLDESFDPLSLPNDANVKIPEKTYEMQDNTAGKGELHSMAGVDTTAMLQKKISGFRVQIYATTDREQAFVLKEEALRIFGKQNINVYMEFDAPYYKIRIGDCKNRDEASKLKRTAMNRGYRKAWVVKTLVHEFPELLFREPGN